ncbi:hypothetical protein ACLBWZ_08015 [Brucellaceae bacterium C25G]
MRLVTGGFFDAETVRSLDGCVREMAHWSDDARKVCKDVFVL